MATKSTQPAFGKTAFTCPNCGAFSAMTWQDFFTKISGLSYSATNFRQSTCNACHREAIWAEDISQFGDTRIPTGTGKMLYPPKMTAPLAHEHMPEVCLLDFEEARSISQTSPRGAAALLRLCVQKLCKELGEPGDNINDDIGSLVKKGLPPSIQQALDTVRVIGNEAVHPGVMSTDDHAEQVNALFELINFIVDRMIAEPLAIKAIYEKLPDAKLKAIAKRDANPSK
ncbi:DUF4145 domain-containing protein [Burkholderia glumae]|uniref:DUF4145 domain-containing protein n=1 Tax=Burkholderia TaxID=32008 RepID=UPI00129700CB|nr:MULTISPECIES: DUF4145 domain-containing protein [Burkholderia]QGA37571.1 DUF4145 domain-containing protein [Burkholderia glumae]